MSGWWMPVLKFVHVAAIALWAGGLLVLPLLLHGRARLRERGSAERLHLVTRRLLLWFASPAAFVAVASGTALIFLRPTQQPWFSAKLALVGALAALHVSLGTLVLRLFKPGERVPAWRLWAAMLASPVLIVLVLLLVLDKPAWSLTDWRRDVFSPGALGDLLGRWIDPLLARVRG